MRLRWRYLAAVVPVVLTVAACTGGSAQLSKAQAGNDERERHRRPPRQQDHATARPLDALLRL